MISEPTYPSQKHKKTQLSKMKAKKSRIIPKKITFQNLWTKIEDCERPPLLFRQIPTYSRPKQIWYSIRVIHLPSEGFGRASAHRVPFRAFCEWDFDRNPLRAPGALGHQVARWASEKCSSKKALVKLSIKEILLNLNVHLFHYWVMLDREEQGLPVKWACAGLE